MWYIDYWYIVLVLPAILFSLWASFMVKSTYNKYSKQNSISGMTAAQVVRRVLDANGLYNVGVGRVAGNLTDHYDPRTNMINLSDTVYSSTSTAAIGVACHEAGHAIQHKEEYLPIKIRTAIIPAANIGSTLAIPLIIIGMILGSLQLSYVGVICFSAVALFQLVTLPTEFDASKRALQTIEANNYLSPAETKGAKKVLTAAAMTYVAALAVTIMQILRFVLILNGGRRNND